MRGKRSKNAQAQAKGSRERNWFGRTAHHAEDELTTLLILSGTNQTRCHQPAWERLPLPSSTQLCRQDHFQLHPTTLLVFPSFNFLLIQFHINFNKKAYSFILLLRTVFAQASLLTAAPGTAQHCEWRDMKSGEKKFCCHVYAVVLKAGSEVSTRLWAKDWANKPPTNHMLASLPI